MDFAISGMLGTNLVPSEMQARVITRMVSVKETEKIRVHLEIQVTRARLEKLAEELDSIQNDIEVHKGLLSPARRVFPEILGEIFWFCLPSDHHTDFDPYYLRPPILFTRVCSAWRQVALSTPRLWRTIFSSVPQISVSIPGIPVDNSVETWLSLSRSCPLSIKLHDGSDSGPPHQDWRLIADSFRRHSSRWEEIELCQPDTFLSMFQEICGRTQWLKTVDITATRWKQHDDNGMEGLAAVLRSAPRLCRLYWTSGWLDFHPSLLSAPWSQLTRLHLDCRILLDDFNKFFPQLVRTEYCYLRRVWGESSRPQLPRHTISLANMKIMNLSSAVDLTSIIQNVILPVIRDLTIHHFAVSNAHPPSTWPQSTFMEMLIPSTCHLRRLALHVQTVVSEDEVLQCLRVASATLIELSLKDSVEVTDKVLLALLPVPEEVTTCATLCKKLSNIQLLNCLCSSDGTLAALIESRWKPEHQWGEYSDAYPGVSCLEQVDVCINSWTTLRGMTDHDDDVKRLFSLQSKGLDCRIDHYVS